MELQKVFKRSYMEELRRNIHVSDYQGEIFPFEPSKVKSLANVYKPEGLLDRLDPEDDFTSAVEIYKAYSSISPLLASLPRDIPKIIKFKATTSLRISCLFCIFKHSPQKTV